MILKPSKNGIASAAFNKSEVNAYEKKYKIREIILKFKQRPYNRIKTEHSTCIL